MQPSVLNLQPGQNGQFRVTFSRTTAPVDQWSSGWLTWTGGQRLTVRSPVALKPLTLGGVPADLTAPAAASGSVRATVLPGTTGALDLTATGLVAGDTRSGRVPVGDVREFPVTIPEGTTFTRFDLVGQAGSDVDLFLYTDGGTLVAQSATTAPTTDRRVRRTRPVRAAGLRLHRGGGASDIGYSVTSYVLGAGAGAGSFTVRPDPLQLTQGRPATVTASWKGVDPSKRYLGTIAYGDTRCGRSSRSADPARPPRTTARSPLGGGRAVPRAGRERPVGGRVAQWPGAAAGNPRGNQPTNQPTNTGAIGGVVASLAGLVVSLVIAPLSIVMGLVVVGLRGAGAARRAPRPRVVDGRPRALRRVRRRGGRGDGRRRPVNPFIVAAEVDEPTQDALDRLRRRHFPPERNRLAAHLTLFHALPGDALGDVLDAVRRACARPAPTAEVTGVRSLGRGAALVVASPGLVAARAAVAADFAGG